MTESSRRVDDLHARYAASLPRKREALASAWQRFRGEPADAARRRDLQTQVHRLAGSAFAYGYDRLGERAREADRQLRRHEESEAETGDAPDALSDGLVAAVERLLDELREAAAEAAATPPPPSALRVLLVEDDPVQAMLAAAGLEAEGCLVRIEHSTDTLWEILTRWPCEAVVLDYWLRGDTAAEAAAMLRREPQFAHIALICFSVERDEQVLRAALDAGCDAALAKHEGSTRLLELIRACVARPDRSGRAFD